jgi:ferredoxin
MTKRLRRAMQVAVIVAAAVTGYRLFAGLSMTSVEKYCPFGGLATSYSLLTSQRFSCATGEFNFAMLLALLVLTFLARKSFCSWICPVGALSEWIGRIAGLARGKKARKQAPCSKSLYSPPATTDRYLRWLRLPVLLAILYFTAYTAELIFRPFCPYYVAFSFHGHEVQMWSYGIMALFVLGVVAIPMVWCRYLCPLGVAMWPFSRWSPLRIRREDDPCTSCGLCDKACAHGLPVSTVAEVTSGECTLCTDCVQVCPQPGALGLTFAGMGGRKLPTWVVAIIVVALVAVGYVGGDLIAIPSFAKEYNARPKTTASVEFIVKGVRCVDSAKSAATVFDGVPGVVTFTAYASRNLVNIEFDPSEIDISTLTKYMEGPVYDATTDQFVFHVFEVLETKKQP